MISAFYGEGILRRYWESRWNAVMIQIVTVRQRVLCLVIFMLFTQENVTGCRAREEYRGETSTMPGGIFRRIKRL